MKLAIVSQPCDRLFPPTQNSVGLVVYHTALELGRRAEVAVYGRHYRDDVPPPALPFSVAPLPVIRDRLLQRFIRRFPRPSERLGIARRLDDHSEYRRKLVRRIAHDRPDIVHVMNYWPWCREIAAAGAPHRLVLEMHCEWLSERDRAAVARQLEVVDAVATVSDHIAATFLAAFPDFPGRVATVGNGVDVARFAPDPGRPAGDGGRRRLLFVGRVSPEKGVHTLLAAFAALAGRFGDVDLDIAGPDAALSRDFLVSLGSERRVQDLLRFYDDAGNCRYRAHLDSLVADGGLRGRVRFLGNVSHEELLPLYRAAEVVVNPSLSESFGMSVVEGMACGIPIVGTRVGGMRETILDGRTGLLVEPEAPQELASALASLLLDEGRARAMGAAGRRRAVEHYSWQARAERLTELYDSLAGDRAEGPTRPRQAARPMAARVEVG